MFKKLLLAFTRICVALVLLSGSLAFPPSSSVVKAIPPLPAPQIQSGAVSYASDHLIVKLRQALAPTLSGSGGKLLENGISGNAGLNRTLAQAGALSLTSLFTPSGQPGIVRQGLDRIYQVQLAPGQSVANALALLQADPAMEYAEPDYLAKAAMVPTDTRYAEQWGLAKIQAEGAWDQTLGSPDVVIAVVDSGIDLAHEDLIDNLWVNPGEIPGNGIDDDNNGYIDDVQGWNFLAGSGDVLDDSGHGTLVSGIAAARINNAKGIAGVCGLCRTMPVKVMQPSGQVNYSDIALGINYASVKGARVINLSVGGYAKSQMLSDAVNAALEQNIILVAGAGNDNKSDPFYPAAYPGVISVAGTDSADLKTNFSNFGDWVKISAPAANVLTTALGGDYLSADGTSMAAPFVSGLVGLLLSQNPVWTPAMVLNQLIHTADPIDTLNAGLEGKLGSGRINALKALEPPQSILTSTGFSANGTAGGRVGLGVDSTLEVSIHNEWLTASGTSATLTTTDPKVTVSTADSSYGDIPTGQTRTNTPDFVIKVASDVGYNHSIPFTLAVTANSGATTKSFDFTVSTRSSDEPVTGLISSDTTWTNDKTYKITADLTVAAGVTLTIQPGTMVQVMGNYTLTVAGTLAADGTADHPILFDPGDAWATWNRILFDDSATDANMDASGTYQSGNLLRYVRIRGAVNGVACNLSTPYLANLDLEGPLVCTLGSTPLWVRDSTITSLTASGSTAGHVLQSSVRGNLALPALSEILDSAINGTASLGGGSTTRRATFGGLTMGGGGTVDACATSGNLVLSSGSVTQSNINKGTLSIGSSGTITGNMVRGGGVIAGNGSVVSGNDIQGSPLIGIQTYGTVTVSGNRVVGSLGTGIQASAGTIQGNLVANSAGDGLRSGAATILNNSFTGNKGRTVYLNAAPIKLQNNNIEFNIGPYDLYYDTTSAPPVPMVIAHQNWWGTTDLNTISGRIYQPTPNSVAFSNKLLAPSQTAPAYIRSVVLNPPSPVGIQTVAVTVTFSRPMDTTTFPRLDIEFSGGLTWRSRPGMTEARQGLGAVVLNGKLFTVGGEASGTVEEFDLYSNTWSARPAMTVPRSFLGVAASGGFIYTIGGESGSSPSAVVEKYDPLLETWQTRSDLPAPRSHMTAVTTTDGLIYVFGGREAGLVATVDRFDPATNAWTVRTPMPVAVADAASVLASSGRIYVFGGNDGAAASAKVMEYDPTTDTWRFRTPMPTARWGSTAVVTGGGRILVMGGSDGTSGLTAIEEYDPESDNWRSWGNLNTARVGFASALTDDGRLFVVGGLGAAPLATVEEAGLPAGAEGFYNSSWTDSAHFRTQYDVTSLAPRGDHTLFVNQVAGGDGLAIAPDAGTPFTIDYAGYISDSTAPNPPVVLAWGDGSLTSLSAHWTASDPDTAITAYRYAVGTFPGGADVVNWTNVTGTTLTRTGLNLTRGRTYYVSIKARNEGGLWSIGGSSNGVKAGVVAVPTLTSISPTGALINSAAFTLTANGSNFSISSIIRWNGANLVTTFVTSAQLTALVGTNRLGVSGPVNITVFTSGGGETPALTFTISSTNPVPVLTGLDHIKVKVNSPGFTLTVSGSGFVNGSVVRWNGTDLTTTFVNGTQLTALVDSSRLTSPAKVNIKVYTPGPGGGVSTSLELEIEAIKQFIPMIRKTN